MALKIASVDRAIARARSHARKGELDQAREFYQAVLEKFPKNKRAIDGLNALQRKNAKQSASAITQEQVNGVIALYSEGRLQEAMSAVQGLISKNSNVPVLHNLSGAIHAGFGQLDQAIASYHTGDAYHAIGDSSRAA